MSPAAEKALMKRIEKLERQIQKRGKQVDALKEIIDQVLALAERDPYEASFRQYQARADAVGGH